VHLVGFTIEIYGGINRTMRALTVMTQTMQHRRLRTGSRSVYISRRPSLITPKKHAYHVQHAQLKVTSTWQGTGIHGRNVNGCRINMPHYTSRHEVCQLTTKSPPVPSWQNTSLSTHKCKLQNRGNICTAKPVKNETWIKMKFDFIGIIYVLYQRYGSFPCQYHSVAETLKVEITTKIRNYPLRYQCPKCRTCIQQQPKQDILYI